MTKKDFSFRGALNHTFKKRNKICPNSGFMKALQKLEHQLNNECFENFMIEVMSRGSLKGVPRENIRKLLEENDWHEMKATNAYYSKM